MGVGARGSGSGVGFRGLRGGFGTCEGVSLWFGSILGLE